MQGNQYGTRSRKETHATMAKGVSIAARRTSAAGAASVTVHHALEFGNTRLCRLAHLAAHSGTARHS